MKFRMKTLCDFWLLTGVVLSLSAADAPADSGLKSNPIPWFQFADFSTLPNLSDGALLNDGDLTTSAFWTSGTEAPGTLFFRFPKPIEVEAFRFTQGLGGVTVCRLYGDTKGTGQYDTLLAEYRSDKVVSNTPITMKVNRKNIHALKFEAIAGQSGYRAPYPVLREIEIFSPDRIETQKMPEDNFPLLTGGRTIPLPPLTKREIDIRLCTDVWTYGLPTSNFENPQKPKIAAPVKNFENRPGIRKTVDYIKSVDANSVRLFVEVPCVYNSLPWKSPLWEGYGDDILKGLTGELHKNGIKLYYFSHAWMAPFQKREGRAPMPYCRWDYPYEQSDRLLTAFPKIYTVKYPCVLCDGDFRAKWTQYLSEALDQGADGVYLMPDEWYFKGHNLSYADCPSCVKEFKKMYGYDSMPKKIEDTEHYRKWKLFEYRKVSELFDEVAKTIRASHPQSKIIRSDCGVGNASRGRLETTTAADIIWQKGNLADAAQMYASSGKREIAFVKDHEAVAGRDKLSGSMQWLNISFPEKPDYGVKLYGIALADVMLGARAIDHYRMSYIQETGWTPNLKKCNQMIRLLEAWSIDKTRVPASVCLLLSRASEDWWSIKERSLISAKNQGAAFYLHLAGDEINKMKNQISENCSDRYHMQNDIRGQGAKAALNNLLVDNGIPYQIRYADRPDTLQDLDRFKLILIPFAYALSKDSFSLLEKAARKGTHIIIFDQLAPVDEFGNPFKEPLLKSLLILKNVTWINESPVGYDSNAARRGEYLKSIMTAIGEEGYAFRANGTEVSYIVTSYEDKSGWILFLANWEKKKDANVTISLPGAKDATYAVQIYSSMKNELEEGRIAGKEKLGVAELAAFHVGLRPGEVKLIRIAK